MAAKRRISEKKRRIRGKRERPDGMRGCEDKERIISKRWMEWICMNRKGGLREQRGGPERSREKVLKESSLSQVKVIT